MEYMNSRDLLSYIRANDKNFKETELFTMAKQISCGMKYLEENNILHK